MEHVTALVDHDATTPAHAGIEVRFINLVGRSGEVRRRVFATEEAVLEWLGANRQHVELVSMTTLAPAGRHTCGACIACMDEIAADEADFESLVDSYGSTVEPYDELVDAALVDAAERRVA